MREKENQLIQGEKFLVTGGAGFIGSNIVEKLLDLGNEVTVLDNFITGKEENIKEFFNRSNFNLIRGDIRNINDCYRACKNVDYVLHQAALGSVPRSIKDPSTSNDVNITGTLNMLLASRDNNVKRFVYASSSSVYGDEPNLPKIEDRMGKPLSPYAITKIVGELYAKNFYDLYGLPTIGLRYFNVFGKKQDPHSMYSAVIPIFIKKLVNNEAPTINGDGLQSRDFTYIDNVIDANLKACLAKVECFGNSYNIAYSERTTLKDLYSKLSKILNIDISPFYGPERPGDIKHSYANIEKAKKYLKYVPKVNLDTGLELSIEWYIKNL